MIYVSALFNIMNNSVTYSPLLNFKFTYNLFLGCVQWWFMYSFIVFIHSFVISFIVLKINTDYECHLSKEPERC